MAPIHRRWVGLVTYGAGLTSSVQKTDCIPQPIAYRVFRCLDWLFQRLVDLQVDSECSMMI